MNYSLLWLPDTLRAAGLTVNLVPGWEARGHGDMGTVRGVLCHHTAGPPAGQGTGDSPSLQTVINGRPDLKGPLSQLFLGRFGAFYVVAAGLAYHAGAGEWHGVTQGNHELIGIEAENSGQVNDKWPDRQMDAYARGCAAILKHVGADVSMCAGHKEYALPHGRKEDPSFEMDVFREVVAQHMV